MVKEPAHISFEEFAADPVAVFERVTADNEPVVVERRDGTAAVLKPVARRRRARRGRVITDEDWEATLATFGAWQEIVDAEKLKRDIAESQRISTRPRIDL